MPAERQLRRHQDDQLPAQAVRYPLLSSKSRTDQDSADLASHPLIGYLDDLLFSEELRYKDNVAPTVCRAFRSTSVVAQYTAARSGQDLAILPCVLARQNDDLVPVLDGQVDIQRAFWLVVTTETRNIARVAALWRYRREAIDPNRGFLMGESREMVYF